MREIKFRVWDKANKVIKYFSCGIFDKVPFGMEDLSELMQYTGSKDIDGVEIYEDDIVKKYYEYENSGLDSSGYYLSKATIIASNGIETMTPKEKEELLRK